MAATFSAATFDFLFDLDVHNEKPWFEANRDRYEAHVRDPMFAFIDAVRAPLHERVSEQLLAIPKINGGSMFRIFRDARRVRDGRPFKTNAGASFRHALADDVHSPGYYLHIEPGNCYMGGGMWKPPTATLNEVRREMIDDPDRWRAVRDTVRDAGFTFGGDSLKTHPRGFDGDHPLIEDLRRTSLVVSHELSEDDITAEHFPDRYAELARTAGPLLTYTCDALDLPW